MRGNQKCITFRRSAKLYRCEDLRPELILGRFRQLCIRSPECMLISSILFRHYVTWLR